MYVTTTPDHVLSSLYVSSYFVLTDIQIYRHLINRETKDFRFLKLQDFLKKKIEKNPISFYTKYISALVLNSLRFLRCSFLFLAIWLCIILKQDYFFSLCLSVCLSLLSLFSLSVCLSLCLSVSLSLFLSLSLSTKMKKRYKKNNYTKVIE